MKYPLATTSPYQRFRANVYRILKRPYLVTALISYSLVGLLIAAYLAKAPSYSSDMELVLPGTGNSSSVTLDNVGQVVSQTSTPFAGGGFNPRVNYKEMLASRAVRERAAKSLNISMEALGQAKIKLTEQTSIIALTTKAGSKTLAQEKAYALYHALQFELDALRADEVFRRDQSIKQVLDQYRVRVNSTRNAIVDFQQRSVVVSTNQMDKLVQTLAGVKERQVYVKAEGQQLEEYINQLSQELGVSPKLAGQAFILQSDVEFRAYMNELEQSITQLNEYSSRWGINHPKVVAQQKRLTFTRTAINNRSTELFGINTTEIFNNLNLDLNPKRSQLFADLIDAYANQKGQSSMLADLKRSADHLSDQLKIYSREIVELERLQREFNMAEAIFTSAAARLEASKADIFASYPVVQMLTTPSFPTKQSSPKKLIAVVIAVTGFIFITLGLVIICQRNKLIALLLKKN
ncbi:GumC family protein [Thalassotalea sp. PLHSN55]|uniref:GumC family protein n=1 Tax=Thalassotalea sp. PLHSN55 TaxID=3435888 RepID=UPI003F87FFED